MGNFSVIEAICECRFEPEPEFDLVAGQELQRAYYKRRGKMPAKQIRRKTRGKGTQRMDVYPPEFWDEALKIVEAIGVRMKAKRSAQPTLFSGGS